MAKLPKTIKVSLDEISQEIDLEKLTGTSFESDQELKREIGQAMIDYMKSRITDKNAGYDGEKLKSPYSKSYSQSLDFDAAGKSESDVNMTLSGDMLGSLDLTDETDSGFKIDLNDPEVLPRAYGHMTGFEGHPNQNKMKKYKRQFFGLSEAEQKVVIKDFKSDISNIKEAKKSVSDFQGQLLERFRTARDLFDGGEE